MPKHQRTPIRGIVVAGNSLEDAQELYRAVATGQDAQALHTADDSFVVLSSASSDINMLNPLTGVDDLKVGDGLVEQMEFLSSDSEAVNVNYTVCTAGCNAHILADDVELLKHCPACASVLEDLTDEQIAALSAGEEDGECDGCQVQESAIASGKTLEEAVAAYRAAITGEGETRTVRSGDVLVAVAGDANYDVYTGNEATVVEDQQPSILESLSSSGAELDAHHFVCASSACGAHVVSSDDMPVFCPSCSSGLLDPEDEEANASAEEDESNEANASDDNDPGEVRDDLNSATASDDDEEEDEDDEDEEDEDLDEDEDEDDDSDEEEDEDEDDESDEDDEDLDEEDEDEDEDDEDALTLSVSSVQYRDQGSRRARNRQSREEAQASAQEPAPMVAVAASFVALSGDMDVSKLDVAYASVQGENAWVAFYDRVPMAIALASACDKHKEIFNSDVFGRAFKAQASQHGVPAALENMGFQEIKPEIQVADYVQTEVAQQVAARTQEVTATAERDKAELQDRLNGALATAALGYSKNFFKGQVNPIAQSLIESLSAVGIDNAAALVSKAFAQHSDAYHSMLFAQANKIMGYSLDTQNEIAEALAGSNASEEAQASSAPMPLGRPVQVEKKEVVREEATASAHQPQDFAQRLNLAVSGLGKR